jgi:hypothetical protein
MFTSASSVCHGMGGLQIAQERDTDLGSFAIFLR